jgi:hypothetical protein
MTLFRLDELTWPEISALPRDVPLIFPVGEPSDWDQLPALISTSQDIGILPVLPFGWSGSGLEVPAEIFSILVHNLVGNLLEDGFTNVQVLTPSMLHLGADVRQVCLSDMRPPRVDLSKLDHGKVVIVPIGHTEQHGFHSPLSTDTIIIEAIGQGTAQAAREQAVCLPVFPYGVSTHRRSFPGTDRKSVV